SSSLCRERSWRLTTGQRQDQQDSASDHVYGAEGVGFEPTVTCATMVFETIRFGRSRIPPGRDSTGSGCAPRSEERGEQVAALLGPHTRDDVDLVIEAGIRGEVVETSGGPGLRIGRAEDHAPDAR